jgi:hypothetical protein
VSIGVVLVHCRTHLPRVGLHCRSLIPQPARYLTVFPRRNSALASAIALAELVPPSRTQPDPSGTADPPGIGIPQPCGSATAHLPRPCQPSAAQRCSCAFVDVLSCSWRCIPMLSIILHFTISAFPLLDSYLFNPHVLRI